MWLFHMTFITHTSAPPIDKKRSKSTNTYHMFLSSLYSISIIWQVPHFLQGPWPRFSAQRIMHADRWAIRHLRVDPPTALLWLKWFNPGSESRKVSSQLIEVGLTCSNVSITCDWLWLSSSASSVPMWVSISICLSRAGSPGAWLPSWDLSSAETAWLLSMKPVLGSCQIICCLLSLSAIVWWRFNVNMSCITLANAYSMSFC